MTRKEIETLVEKIVDYKIDLYFKTMKNLQIKDIKVLLYNYTKYKQRIEILKNELNNKELVADNFGVTYDGEKVQGGTTYQDILIKTENKKELIKKELMRYSYIINSIDKGLNVIRHEKYFKIIELKYFEKKHIDEILKSLDITKSTYHRHHYELLSELNSMINL